MSRDVKIRWSHSGTKGRRRRGLIAVIVTAGVLVACQPASGERRGPVELGGNFGATVDGQTLGIEVPSCGGDPVLARLLQQQDAIRVEVITTVQIDVGDACLDAISVVLDAPLGDRAVIDLTSGRVIDVEGGE